MYVPNSVGIRNTHLLQNVAAVEAEALMITDCKLMRFGQTGLPPAETT
jgi:hypothetical protein